jgi:hypothetical protein
VDYEGLTVYRCELCEGYLVAEDELRELAGHRAPDEQLEREARAETEPDSAEFLPCPRCRDEMVKEVIHGPKVFTVDACKDCRLLWFDGGELPRMRMAYEDSLEDGEAPGGPELLHALLGDSPFEDW